MQWSRRSTVIVFLLLLAALPAAAQEKSTADRIIDAALNGSRAYDHVSYLADNIGPRLSGSKGAELAVKWSTAQFRQWGIDVRNEKVTVPVWVRGAERARLVSHNNQKIVLTALGGSVATPTDGIMADVVRVASFEELQALGHKGVKGKIVFYDNPMNRKLIEEGRAFEAYRDAVVFRGVGASRAAEFGAVASLIRSVASDSLRTPHTGSVRYDAKYPKIPAAAMTTEDAGLVSRLIAKGEKVRMHLVLTPRTLPNVASANVVAEIRGSERPDEIVLLAAHLDSWDLGTGAIDDGAGVAMIMETMRIYKELGVRPKRTVRCVLFMNEENGLNGARTYFNDHKDQVDKHVAAIETDAGSAMPQSFLTTLADEKLEDFERRADILARVGAARFATAKQTGADTSFLVEAGVPGFSLVPNPRKYFHYHHTPADTLDKIDPAELAQNTAAVAALAYVIADSDASLR
jgi:hypothetical protein